MAMAMLENTGLGNNYEYWSLCGDLRVEKNQVRTSNLSVTPKCPNPSTCSAGIEYVFQAVFRCIRQSANHVSAHCRAHAVVQRYGEQRIPGFLYCLLQKGSGNHSSRRMMILRGVIVA